ncbi:hypothetical protein H0H87_005451 [Tephrocybe sp. NHM501043]|nr:hypothetical protein H0H87_005451 [Tephrocybe sp. NHM501043]
MWYSRKPIVEINDPPTLDSNPELGGRREKPLQDSLDRHVDDVLRRPSKFRRTMMGVWSFLKTQFVEPIARPGILWIWHYKRKTRRLRIKAGLPVLFDEDDLPDPKYDSNYVHVLTEKEEKFLYKRASYDHAESNVSSDILKLGIDPMEQRLTDFQRPAWSTGILIPSGFIVGIAAAVLIWRGGEKTKRVAQVEERLRAALSADDDAAPSLPVRYPPSKRRNAEKMAGLPEGLDEDYIKVDEQMTVPSTSDTRIPSSH